MLNMNEYDVKEISSVLIKLENGENNGTEKIGLVTPIWQSAVRVNSEHTRSLKMIWESANTLVQISQ